MLYSGTPILIYLIEVYNDEVKIIPLPRIYDSRGNLSIIENLRQMPFVIKHIKWLFNISSDCHIPEYHTSDYHTLLIALSGSFDIIVTHNHKQQHHHLNNAHSALFLPANANAEICNFSTNSVAVIIQTGTTNAQV